ncbi:MBL fold metallo-hydrolase [Candidatus Micrarchaeota archaeon]|nr:MBL fold metallo-hydrolase [Candidatus Micrarchaeota archaeon]MBD3417901.1 MBL fold metallo-hydrolase [Candidatus Micrarchaeota archaeon]
MLRKMFVLFAVLLLFAGCPSEETAPEPVQGNGEEENGEGVQGYFEVEEGTATSASAGPAENGEGAAPPAINYAEEVNENLFVYFITVGYADTQGDAILVKKGDFDMVIDGGPVEKKHDVVNFLFEKGVDDIEILVSTHEDPEHSGGLSYIGENFRVGEVWRPVEGSASYGEMLEGIGAEQGVEYMGRGDERIFNGMHILVRNPMLGDERFFDSDNDAIVLRVEDRGFCLLLTSDIDGSAQTQILMDSEPCDVVQMPWHGMSEGLSSIDFFFDKLEPRDIIVSGSSKDWTNSRQTLYNKAALRDIGVYENYEGDAAKITYNGDEFSIMIEG